MEYSWPSSVNVANFVTVKPDLKNEEERSKNFKLWKKQMVSLVESQDVAGFINGEIVEPQGEEQKLWRRSDRLVQGWILGSIGTDVLDKVCELETAREVWLELEKIFNDKEAGGSDQSSRHLSIYLPLHNAALSGDWETAYTLFFQNNIEETEAKINNFQQTALHVAVQSKKANDFVRNLVSLMSPQALAFQDNKGCTALHRAARVGNTYAARLMVQKYPDLLYIKDDYNELAVITAGICCQKETVEYLISVSKPHVEHTPFEGQLGIALLTVVILSEFLDVALDLVNEYPDLARLRGPSGNCALSVMAGERDNVFLSRESYSWWEKLIYHCVPLKQNESRLTSLAGDIEAPNSSTLSQSINGVGKQFNAIIWKVLDHLMPGVKNIKNKKQVHKQAVDLVNCLCREMRFLPEDDALSMLKESMFSAAEHGINEIVEVIMEMYPYVADSGNDAGRTIMDLAVCNRFENIFNLTYSMSDRKHLFASSGDNEQNNLLHMCAKSAPLDRLSLVSGAALQMQRELQWFNEIQKFVPPSRRNWENSDGKTQKMLFTEEHQDLKEQGEKWMKDTANACSIATALIATVVFAAAFTVPGGLLSETGIPVFFERPAFILFATTNAVSMFTSITSLMMFLSILTSRYAEEDFLHVLPKRLCYGLLSLFISVLFMLVAFSAALYLIFHKKLLWFIIPVAAFGWWPVASFVLLQFPLLVDVFYSTFGPGIFGKRTNRLFY